jgi:hypothetical protein
MKDKLSNMDSLLNFWTVNDDEKTTKSNVLKRRVSEACIDCGTLKAGYLVIQ